ncbi:fungal-specific transcription factor domain-containing protein [Amylocarpus encephaloides]|uniref:Fungal-specific transcription factor domain-containing protein n=1 Tax=Amylocarpus encephaloides TaxID=45428 RepID=A0A9P8C617_9HELO|nr:fungal-specific transcription factor domain-containing protein [Amylocarpus encephaloides]
MSTTSSTPNSIRKRVLQACKLCAFKKIKCDGELPSCSPCVIRNQECEYGASKRKRSSQAYILGGPVAVSSSNMSSSPPNLAKKPPPSQFPPATSDGSGLSSSVFAIPAEISKRLFQAYFESIHPMWPILYKPLYTSLDLTYPSPTIPAALVLAIFSIGSGVDRARYPRDNTSSGLQQFESYPEPKILFEEAFNLLQQGTGKDTAPRAVNTLVPSIQTCQVLTILALQQHGVAEYSRAAILCGLASSMAIELHLHRVYEPNEPIEREIRSRLWWNLYILEKMISSEQGRPIILRAEESDCPWPSISESDEFELMTIPPNPKDVGLVSGTSIKLRTLSALHTTISMSIIIEDTYRQIYGYSARQAIRQDPPRGERIRMELYTRLLDWERNMPAELRVDLEDLTSVPAAITNMVIMLTEIIMLHRPFIQRWMPGRPDEDPALICLQAANRMCSILEKYLERGHWPCDMVFSIFVAASTLLQHSKQASGNDAIETKTRLKLCIHWLSVLGRSWKTAGARQQLLTDLFDLPPALQEYAPDIDTMSIANLMPQTTSTGQSNPMHSTPLASHVSNPSDDWSFLNFGDSSDQFYDWDTELRNLLNSNLQQHPNGNSYSQPVYQHAS